MAVTDKLKNIADAIRKTTLYQDLMALDEMAVQIEKLGEQIDLDNKDVNDITIEGGTIKLPAGSYADGIQITLKDWFWDPPRFDSSIITDASEVESITSMN